jgi:hypothetical protein
MNSASNNKTLAQESLEASVWNVRPFQIVSLLEMLEHRVNLFYTATHFLCRLRLDIDQAIADPARGLAALPDLLEANRVRHLEKRLRAVCDDEFEYERVLERISYLNGQEPRLQPLVGGPFTLGDLKHHLDELTNEIMRALGSAKFLMIPSYDAAYYDNPDLFGPTVAQRFPKANKEITEAGSCYASSRYTACVFHLMRAVELGARRMVSKLKVRQHLVKNGHPVPVELCDWGMLIAALDKGVAASNYGTTTSKRRKETFEFYNQAVGQFRNFKDAWRNHMSHTRDPYDKHKAMSVMENTRQLMQHLATRLTE